MRRILEINRLERVTKNRSKRCPDFALILRKSFIVDYGEPDQQGDHMHKSDRPKTRTKALKPELVSVAAALDVAADPPPAASDVLPGQILRLAFGTLQGVGEWRWALVAHDFFAAAADQRAVGLRLEYPPAAFRALDRAAQERNERLGVAHRAFA